LVDQTLAESFALVSISEGFFDADARESSGVNDDTPTLKRELIVVSSMYGRSDTYLVVEVAHDVLESFVLFADQVFNGYLDVFEGNVSGARGPDTGALHLTAGDTGHVALNQQQ
jgi:hypothetical protein